MQENFTCLVTGPISFLYFSLLSADDQPIQLKLFLKGINSRIRQARTARACAYVNSKARLNVGVSYNSTCQWKVIINKLS